MTTSPFDSAVLGPLFGDPEMAALLADSAQIRALLTVEAALARVQGRLGVIPADAATRIAEVAAHLEPDMAAIGAGTARDGVPIPALIKALRAGVGKRAAPYVHWGATSQDIVDTGLVLRLRDALTLLAARLEEVIAALTAQARAHRGLVMAARTRSQIAMPTTFGLKVATWLAPLLRHRDRLAELRPRLEVVQFGGAAGTLAALGEHGIAVMEGLAAELGLAPPPLPWHSQGDIIAELGGWLSLLTGSLGKMGEDLVLLGQSEVGEVTAGDGGGSSTMPNKSNPVAAETLVALARFNAGMVGTLHQALIQRHERDGAAWPLTWLALPPMLMVTAGALAHAQRLAAALEPNAARMAEHLEATHGLILAEAATFLLAAHMPRPQAQELVAACCKEATAAGRHLFDILAERADAPIDWPAEKDPARHVGAAEALVKRLIP
ncbi:3-carboxy-cis,cis-muconate cycloisomerase [Shumkonia mesophila]|uniref:3-carboxy-cis,cis-muconate cycloisomerase n=1 Tax=Shumkonia mesophila TaxID=2838854 RepID=UPI0029349160|nr:3-carboxy-cis,cis-muconate cycloisomerase [Shumkonia mesophila]